MVIGVVPNVFMRREPILEQFPGFGIIDGSIFDNDFGRSHVTPPWNKGSIRAFG